MGIRRDFDTWAWVVVVLSCPRFSWSSLEDKIDSDVRLKGTWDMIRCRGENFQSELPLVEDSSASWPTQQIMLGSQIARNATTIGHSTDRWKGVLDVS